MEDADESTELLQHPIVPFLHRPFDELRFGDFYDVFNLFAPVIVSRSGYQNKFYPCLEIPLLKNLLQEQSMSYTILQNLQNKTILGSGCGSVGRVVSSGSRGPLFESSHRQTFICCAWDLNQGPPDYRLRRLHYAMTASL